MERENGIPKEREVDKRREVCEWEGCVCVCETVGASSMLRIIRKTVTLARMLLTLDLSRRRKLRGGSEAVYL